MQPDLSRYYGNLKTDKDYKIEGKIAGIWAKIGSGRFSGLAPINLSFEGEYDALGHKGKVALSIVVTGMNTGTVDFNGDGGQCKFEEDGDYLHVLFDGKNIKLEWWKDGIWIGGDGPPVDLWIGD